MSFRDEDYHIYGGVNYTEHSGIDFGNYSLEELKKTLACNITKRYAWYML